MVKKKVMIAAGGSGGHLFPALALARQLKEECEVVFAGTGLSKNPFFQEQKEKWPFIDVKGSSRCPLSILKGVWQSFRELKKAPPDLVVGFGSYHTFGVLVGAILARIPFVLFNADVKPGKVVRWLAPFAKWRASPFSSKCPVAFSLKQDLSTSSEKRQEGFAYFGLDPHQRTVLIFGGSQGAKPLNKIVPEGIDASIQVLHFAGKELKEVQEIYQKRGVKAVVKGFEERMDYAWSVADLVICRAGAVTLAEAVTAAVPPFFVPYPFASENHQLDNARFLEDKGGEWVLQEELTREKVHAWVHTSPEELEKKRQLLKQFLAQMTKITLAEKVIQWLNMYT